MKYMILIHGSQQDYDAMVGKAGEVPAWSADDFTALEKGLPVVTDGPYAESQEVLASYWIVDCASFDRATQIAARLAQVPGPASIQARSYVDVRPILESRADLES